MVVSAIINHAFSFMEGFIMQFTNSEALHKEAQKHIVGGVNSPSRAYKGVGGGSPVYMERAKGGLFLGC